MLPDFVLESWRVKADGYLTKQRWHHTAKTDTFRGTHCSSFEECWDCGRERARCRTKVRHDTIDSAWAHCDGYNTPSAERLLVPYWCYWSEGLHWHVRTAKGSADRRQARKRMSKLLRKEGP